MTDDIRYRPLADGPFAPSTAWGLRISSVVIYMACIGYFVLDTDLPIWVVIAGVVIAVGLGTLPSLLDLFAQASNADR